ASCPSSKEPKIEAVLGALRSRHSLGEASSCGTLSGRTELRRVVVFPGAAGRDARADDARASGAGLAIRVLDDARIRDRRRGRIRDRLVRARCRRAAATGARLLGELSRGDGDVRTMGIPCGARGRLLADPVQGFHDRRGRAALHAARVRRRVVHRPGRAVLPRRRAPDLGRPGHGAQAEAAHRYPRVDHGRLYRRRARDLRVAMRAAPIALMVLMIAGCAGSSGSLVEYAPRVHVVQPGETLFGIAWHYGLDHRDLARWNGLDDPDFIRVGQRLRLTPASGTGAVAANASQGRGGANPSSTSGAAARPAPAPLPSSPPPEWRWPTSGPIVSRFGTGGDGVTTGIAVGGREGQPIEAAASGRVVYAGSGLIGYGQLVIIRHNDTNLSAYGYNSRLLVEQGQSVARGKR